jgi:hypothetical protein
MEIVYLTSSQLNRQTWDQAVAAARPVIPYAFSWYLDVVAAQGWDALLTPDYGWLLPLPYLRRWRWVGPKSYYQPLFTQQLGIIGAHPPPADVCDAMLKAIPGPWQLALHAGHDSAGLATFSPKARPNLCLPLDTPYEELFRGYDKALRKRLRKARPQHDLRAGIVSPRELVALYRGMLNHKVGLAPRHYRMVERLIKAALVHEQGQIWSVSLPGGQIGAAGFFLHHGGRIINLFGSSTEVGYAAHSMHVLLDGLIERFAGQPGWLFDFEGSTIPSVARFFANFGSQDHPYWLASHP